MTTTTPDQVAVEIKNVVALLDNYKSYAASTFITDAEAVRDQSNVGDYHYITTGEVQSVRSTMSNLFQTARALLRGPILNMGKAIGSDAKNEAGILVDLYDYMATTPKTFKERNFTFGSASLTSPTTSGADGVLKRLTVDENGYDLEGCSIATIEAVCDKDKNTNQVQIGRQEFAVRYQVGETDELDWSTFRRRTTVTAWVASYGENSLKNASFETIEGTAAVPTNIPNWTNYSVSAGTTPDKIVFDETNYYRLNPAEDAASQGRSLQFTNNDKIEQTFLTAGIKPDPAVPIYFGIAYNRAVNSCNDGTLEIAIYDSGNNKLVSKSVALAAQTGWNILELDLDENLYYKAFEKPGLKVRVELSGSTTYNVLVDDIIFANWNFFDQGWIGIRGGATEFVVDDYFTYSNSLVGADAKIMYWLTRAYEGLQLPVSGTPSWSDP